MINTLNFFIEANVILTVVVLLYFVFLRNETDFKFNRLFLLIGLIASAAVPFIKFSGQDNIEFIPAIGATIPSFWLPEVVISAQSTQPTTSWWSIGNLLLIIYVIGSFLSLIYFLYQVGSVLMYARKRVFKKVGKIRIAFTEENECSHSFSFFNYIFIANSESLTTEEKQQIIEHETIHAKQLHSVDIILISLFKIVFWFNPIVSIYKKIFVQIHEFEADARSVKVHDVNRYCNLLARVALQTAGLSLGNHFNNSLTIKRIQMMRTIKSKIKLWKLSAVGFAAAVMFMAIACQDQLSAEGASEIPSEVIQKFEVFKKQYPGETFLVEYNEAGDQKLSELNQKYGEAKHIELITVKDSKGVLREFSMLQFTQTDYSQLPVYSEVDKMPEYKNGFPELLSFLQSNVRYPAKAREAGIEGKVFVEFIVEPDGSITNIAIKNGVETSIDEETLRVMKLMPSWTPGVKDGKVVRTKVVLPVNFKM